MTGNRPYRPLRWKCVLAFLAIICSLSLRAQQMRVTNPDVIQMDFRRVDIPLRELAQRPAPDQERVRPERLGYHPKDDWILHESVNPDALPAGEDPALQKDYPPMRNRRDLVISFAGMGYTGVNPSDPVIDVGPDHVVQMINGSSGARVAVFDKDGNTIVSPYYLDGLTGISGLGDPIVIYDQLADRWLLTEFASGSNTLVVAISQTGDPGGAYYVYSLATPDFPDYPKYAVWQDAYYVTTNEANQAAYALERDSMLVGAPATAQRFTMPSFPTIGFQAATPVNLDGTTLPPANTPGLIMRMADDAWSVNIPADRLEMYEFVVDFDSSANSSLTLADTFHTDPFDTHLCGYTSFSCIEQPSGSPDLDPLREVLMHKIAYRNFGSHAAIVCNHVTDIDGTDHAGVRWYELRNTGADWGIHQQGTYAPDGDSRWMGASWINEEGSIGLAFNVSSSSTYPSLRYTGRTECDPPGVMAEPETTFAAGTASNASNRYGDYNCLTIDPADGSFWATGQYNPSSQWATRIANFEIDYNCFGFELMAKSRIDTICTPYSAVFSLTVELQGEFKDTVTLSVDSLPAGLAYLFSETEIDSAGISELTVSNTGILADGIYPVYIKGYNSDTVVEFLTVYIRANTEITGIPQMTFPTNGQTHVPLQPVFQWLTPNPTASYRLQVSSHHTFATPEIDAWGIGNTQFSPGALLDPATYYFWRVLAYNDCDTGNFSDIYLFRTEGCITFTSTDVPVTIVSNNIVTSDLAISMDLPITELEVYNLTIDHNWIGNLAVQLESPAGTAITLVTDICGMDNDMDLTFDDDGNPYASIPCPPTDGGSYQPLQALSAFDGESTMGIWTLSISDDFIFTNGTLTGWSLRLCHEDPGECVDTVWLAGEHSGLFQAGMLLENVLPVTAGDDLTVTSGGEILWTGELEIPLGTIFTATIEECVLPPVVVPLRRNYFSRE